MININKNNFYSNSIATFTEVQGAPKRAADYQSTFIKVIWDHDADAQVFEEEAYIWYSYDYGNCKKFKILEKFTGKYGDTGYKCEGISSQYWYTDKGVYRKSDHWGRVKLCQWPLEKKGFSKTYTSVGYCAFENFNTYEATYADYFNALAAKGISYSYTDKNFITFSEKVNTINFKKDIPFPIIAEHSILGGYHEYLFYFRDVEYYYHNDENLECIVFKYPSGREEEYLFSDILENSTGDFSAYEKDIKLKNYFLLGAFEDERLRNYLICEKVNELKKETLTL